MIGDASVEQRPRHGGQDEFAEFVTSRALQLGAFFFFQEVQRDLLKHSPGVCAPKQNGAGFSLNSQGPEDGAYVLSDFETSGRWLEPDVRVPPVG